MKEFLYIYYTCEDKSSKVAFFKSWMVTDLTPARMIFLAISTPSPPIPHINMFEDCILRIALIHHFHYKIIN